MATDLVSRTVSQGLAGPRPKSVADAVRRVVGLPVRDVFSAALAARARTDGLVLGDVDDAITSGAVVRTWVMRGALQLVAAEDAGWLVALLGPRASLDLRERRHRLGLDDAKVAHGTEVIAEAAVRPRTRPELLADLAAAGMALDDSRAFAQLVSHAAMTGEIVRTADRDGEPTFLRVEPVVADESVLLTRLATRYLESHAPAGWEDFATWSGLPTGKAKAAFTALYPPGPRPEPPRTVRLLGHGDPYLTGYRLRTFMVPSGFEDRIEGTDGTVNPVVLVDGAAVGTWGLSGDEVQVAPFAILPRGVGALLRVETAELGHFLGRPLTLRERA